MVFSLSAYSHTRAAIRSVRLFIPVALLLLTGARGLAQGTPKYSFPKDFLADSLKKALSLARTDNEKVYDLSELSDYYEGIDQSLSQQYGKQAVEVAELSRDRRLIALAYLRRGHNYLDMGGLEDRIDLALENYQDAEKTARENGLDEELAYSYAGLSRVFRSKGDNEKALNYNNLALSIASGSSSDSLKVVAYTSMGNTYAAKNEKLLAFRNYLEALDVAELSKKNPLLVLVYNTLSEFFVEIEEYDKAIDYSMKVLAIHRKDNMKYDMLDDYNNIGRDFTRKKQIDLALGMYENAIALADTLHFPNYNLTTYLSITNMYFLNNDVLKATQFLNSHPVIMDFFVNSGMGFFIDQGYGSLYSSLGRYDSAAYFFKKAGPQIEQKANQSAKFEFYREYAIFCKLKKDNRVAIDYFLKARKIGASMNDIRLLQICDQELDTLYGRTGDFKTAYYYNTDYNKCRDSIRVMSKETDVLKLEVDNDNKRRDRQAKEEEESTLRRHNIQYMGLTAGLAGLFVVLVMMGLFIVSPRTIRALGFFSFIFLFEFIILLADKQIHEITHGEPWKILFIKILLAAILLPLHHWLEHKVIHYLTSRRKIAGGFSLMGKWFRKPGGASPEHG